MNYFKACISNSIIEVNFIVEYFILKIKIIINLTS